MKNLILVMFISAFATAQNKDAARALASDGTQGETITGWFSCDRCAPASRLTAEQIRPANRECVQKCIADGARLIFLDEKSRTMLAVNNPDDAKGQESHYVEVTGTIDNEKKSLTVTAVKVLAEYTASCSLPQKKK